MGSNGSSAHAAIFQTEVLIDLVFQTLMAKHEFSIVSKRRTRLGNEDRKKLVIRKPEAVDASAHPFRLALCLETFLRCPDPRPRNGDHCDAGKTPKEPCDRSTEQNEGRAAGHQH
mgnify:CR=1 FL=1